MLAPVVQVPSISLDTLKTDKKRITVSPGGAFLINQNYENNCSPSVIQHHIPSARVSPHLLPSNDPPSQLTLSINSFSKKFSEKKMSSYA